MADYDFLAAKPEMDFVLKSFKRVYREDVGIVIGVKFPLDYPLLIGKGTYSLVFKVPRSGLVGKSSLYQEVPKERDPAHEGYYVLFGRPSGLMARDLEATIESLREMGFNQRNGISFPEMQEHECKVSLFGSKPPVYAYYTLMPDLREGSKYQVQDAEGFNFDAHGFGSKLRELYEKSCEEILRACKSGSYKFAYASHGTETEPEPAIRHIFLIQFNDEQGNLCIADLNHLSIKKREG